MHHPSRGGVRGGKDQFEWESVKTDKHRENYLGHSVMAPVGRWQKGKDLTWYAKDKESKIKQQQMEKDKIKHLEEEAMAAALGFGTVKKKTAALTKQEIAETLKRGQTERDSGNVERVEGMGFGSARAAMMDISRSNDGFVKEPEGKNPQVTETPTKESIEDEHSEEHKKRKKKKKHKTEKSNKASKKERRRKDDTRTSSSTNKDKETKSRKARERSRSSDSENGSRFRRENKYKDFPNEHVKRKRRHDSNSSGDGRKRQKERESRASRRRERHDS